MVTPKEYGRYPFLNGGFLTFDKVIFTDAPAVKFTPAKLHENTGMPGVVDALTYEPTIALFIFNEHVALLLDRILKIDEVYTPP